MAKGPNGHAKKPTLDPPKVDTDEMKKRQELQDQRDRNKAESRRRAKEARESGHGPYGVRGG